MTIQPTNAEILILLPDLRGGGVERVRLELARQFAKAGYKVNFLLMSRRGELIEEASKEFDVVDLGAKRIRQLPTKLFMYLRNTRANALLAAMWPLTSIAPLAARSAGFRGSVLVSEHSMLSIHYGNHSQVHYAAMRASLRLGYMLATARIGVSQGVCDDIAQLAGMAPSRMTRIFNPVRAIRSPDTSQLAQANDLWGEGGRRILSVGNLKNVKNHALLLRAFALLPDHAVKLMLIGKGANEAALRELAGELGIAERVIFAGFHADPTAFYHTADLFVLSSNNEGFGNVIVEALSCGLPVVSTDCPSGPAEILENGRYGRLTPVGDAQALATAMQEALAAPGDREALKRRAADFSPEKAARQYLEAVGLA